MLVTAVFFAGYGWGYKDGDAARHERLFEELITLIESTVATDSHWDTSPEPLPMTGDHDHETPGCPPGEDPFSGNPFE